MPSLPDQTVPLPLLLLLLPLSLPDKTVPLPLLLLLLPLLLSMRPLTQRPPCRTAMRLRNWRRQTVR